MRQCDALGLTYCLFEAVEGLRLGDADYQNHPNIPYDSNSALNICGRELTAPEKGCSLSHLKIYQDMSNSDQEWLCVLEDDAVLKHEFPAVLEEIEKRPELEMVLLGHFSRRKWSYQAGAETAFFGKTSLLGGYRVEKPVELPLATCGYVIKRSAAKKLLEFGVPLRLPPDWLTGASESFGINLYVVKPPVVVVEQLLHENSTIGNRMAGLVAPIHGTSGLKRLWAYAIHWTKTLTRGVIRFAARLGIARKTYVWVFNRNGLAQKPG